MGAHATSTDRQVAGSKEDCAGAVERRVQSWQGGERDDCLASAEEVRVLREPRDVCRIPAVVVAADAKLPIDQHEAVAVGDGGCGGTPVCEGNPEAVPQEPHDRVA